MNRFSGISGNGSMRKHPGWLRKISRAFLLFLAAIIQSGCFSVPKDIVDREFKVRHTGQSYEIMPNYLNMGDGTGVEEGLLRESSDELVYCLLDICTRIGIKCETIYEVAREIDGKPMPVWIILGKNDEPVLEIKATPEFYSYLGAYWHDMSVNTIAPGMPPN